MVNFLFWNINRKPIEQIVANLAAAHGVDVLILAECKISNELMMEALGRTNSTYFSAEGYSVEDERAGIRIYSRFPSEFLKPQLEAWHWTIRRFNPPGHTEIVLAVAHLHSQRHWPSPEVAFDCRELSKEIQEVEKKVGHSKSLLVGDLNLDPFEEGISSASGLHAVMTREIAMRRSRMVAGHKFPFFYNPMWGCWGDRTDGPPGTYYYDKSSPNTLFWHLFDQVLLRPDLLDAFSDSNLKILTTDGTTSFLSARGRPSGNIASDHLPILFSLEL